MIIALIGSRTLKLTETEIQSICSKIKTLYPDVSGIVTGNPEAKARGADRNAFAIGRMLDIPVTWHEPDWSKGRGAGPIRNTLIIKDCSICFALIESSFKTSTGSLDSVSKAIKSNKPTWVYYQGLNQWKQEMSVQGLF